MAAMRDRHIAGGAIRTVVVLVCLTGWASTTWASGDGLSLAERLEILKAAYPDHIASVDSKELRFKDGRVLAVDDGRAKSHQDKLKKADIEDMLSQVYPIGKCFTGKPARNFDPGRIRSDAFFRAIYGGSKKQARSALVPVSWFGKHIRFTKTAGADRALAAAVRDLDKLPKKLLRYLVPSAGTFNWRNIAGTKRLSVHSFGAAVDINTKFADYWRWSGGKPANVPRYKNKVPMEIVEVFERHGFVWGGKWYHYDTMHFEYRPGILAIARRYAELGCPS